MSKYEVKRTDGRDNKDEVYVVIRVDLGAKFVWLNRICAKYFGMYIGGNDCEGSIAILKLLKDLEESEVKCTNCKGRGDFEVSCGQHHRFKKCDVCKGKTVVKK